MLLDIEIFCMFIANSTQTAICWKEKRRLHQTWVSCYKGGVIEYHTFFFFVFWYKNIILILLLLIRLLFLVCFYIYIFFSQESCPWFFKSQSINPFKSCLFICGLVVGTRLFDTVGVEIWYYDNVQIRVVMLLVQKLKKVCAL